MSGPQAQGKAAEQSRLPCSRQQSHSGRAAIRAGIPASKASYWAAQLLKRDDIQELIANGVDEEVAAADVTENEVVVRLRDIDTRVAALGDNAKALELRYKIWSKLGEKLGMWRNVSSSEVEVNVHTNEIEQRFAEREARRKEIEAKIVEGKVLNSAGVSVVVPPAERSEPDKAPLASDKRELVQSSSPAPAPRNDFTTPYRDWVGDRLQYLGEK
jgi:hypothetical protein